MSENTAIAWTNHTLNLISGCVKLSAGCQFCYAAALLAANIAYIDGGALVLPTLPTDRSPK